MTSSFVKFSDLDGNGRGAKDKKIQLAEFLTGRQCLISRPQFKNRQEFTFTRFGSLEK